MSLNDPIFNDDPLFGNKLKKTSCPAKSDICGNLPGVSVLPNYILPKCNDFNFKFSSNPEESPSGCCVVETTDDTCAKYVPESSDINEDDYDMGIQFLDETGKNPRRICHSAPIRKRSIKIQDFFISILLSSMLIIIIAFVGCCYEFWIKYGDGKSYKCNSLEYKNNCGTTLSPIDYAFPSSLTDYPYKPCSATSKLKFPYSWLDYANVEDTKQNIGDRIWKLLGVPRKSFCLNFLYTLLFSRLSINTALKYLSASYKELGDAPAYKNIIFLLLSGIIFTVIGKYTGIQEMSSGPGFILLLLIMVVVVAMIATMFLTNFCLYWGSEFYNKYINITGTPLHRGYTLFYNIFYENMKDGKIQLVGILLNTLLFLVAIISYSICVTTGFVGSLIGLLWMTVSILYNIFIVPILNYRCLCAILIEHSILLSVLFCISVVISSSGNLNSTTSGIMGGLVALLILYNTYKNMTK